jgi:hypothetical protein
LIPDLVTRIEIIELFSVFGVYAQSSAQNFWTNADALGCLVFVAAAVIVAAVVVMLAAIVAISAKVNKLGSIGD